MDYLPETPTQEQRERAQASDIYRRGDLRLVWVMESELCPPLRACWQCEGAGTYTTLIGEATVTMKCEACR